MSKHSIHDGHDHKHGPNCGHSAIQHEGHIDYLHDGHMHHLHGDHVDCHTLDVGPANPDACTRGHACEGHLTQHKHGAGCGHELVPHGDHYDYLVEGHLHHVHGDHCDHHGAVVLR